MLKDLHIPFRTKVKIQGREVDFLIGKYAVEIDAHKQDVSKNEMLVREGYIPLHLNNWEVKPHLKKWQEQIFSPIKLQQSKLP